jgi:DNA helicase-2/ATP-dependent DNA helicase PcrA
VRHATFGDGEIFSARPMGGDVLYEVVFERVGTKKLMGNFARMKKIN